MSTECTLSERISLLLSELVVAHSKGLETTIYADSAALQIINASFKDGVLGLIENNAEGGWKARNVKSLEEYNNDSSSNGVTTADKDTPLTSKASDVPDCLPNGSHAMFIVASVAWPNVRGNIWPAMVRILLKNAHTSCTLCSFTDPVVWPDIAACYPPDKQYFRTQQLTRESVSLALLDLLKAGCVDTGISLDESPVAIATMPAQTAMPLTKDVFILPDAGAGLSIPQILDTCTGSKKEHQSSGSNSQMSYDDEVRQQMECVSLNVASFLKGLRVRGRFYSFGDFSSRVARRCMGLARSSGEASESGFGSDETIVILLDRALDLVSPAHHNNRLLDQMYHGLPVPCSSNSPDNNENDRLVISEDLTEQNTTGRISAKLPLSLLSLLRASASSPNTRLFDSYSSGTNEDFGLWETLLMNEKSVAMQMLRRKLVDILQRVDGNPDRTLSLSQGKVTVDQLQMLADLLANAESTASGFGESDYALVNIARSVVNVEAAAKREHWSEIEGAEKTLKLIIGGIKDTLQESVDQQQQQQQHSLAFSGASLLGSSSRRRGENANDGVSDQILETEMAAAWDQIIAGIPRLTPSMVDGCVKANVNDKTFEKRVARWLLKHTPAPGMIIMAASLLAPARCGIPEGQRALAEQRLVGDYIAVWNAMAAQDSSRQQQLLNHEATAERWATRVMDVVENVVVGHGQRGKATTQWREIVGLSQGFDDIYTPLVGKIAADVLNGGACADLKHAEHGMGVAAAANLLKGLGRRFLSGASSAASGGGTGDGGTLSTGLGHQQSQYGGAGDVAASCNTVVFFVVGGITFEEAAAVTAAAQQFGGERRVLVGGTGISTLSSILLDI
ncbi:hypothetical protein IWW48_002439 [Coemansia sp. RSA 1200]|nr:hypothetical protein IWW48_002439 [Coemansia sp. RSA 1200]